MKPARRHPVFTAVLLAGGKSSRMGRDKCLLEFEGVQAWRYQLDKIESLHPLLTLVAAPAKPQWCPDSVPWCRDAVADCGPLAGVVAALRRSETPHLLVLAVDLLLMTAGFMDDLLQFSEDGTGAVPVLDEFMQPLCAVYPASILDLAEQELSGPKRSLNLLNRTLLEQGKMKPRFVPPAERGLFLNCNNPVDLPENIT